MPNIAFIPIRSGSKSIPNKNIKEFCGKPLVQWVTEAALDSNLVDKIVIATDKDYRNLLKKMLESLYPTKKVEVYIREKRNSRDGSYTEDVILEWIGRFFDDPEQSKDNFILLQATNPFITSQNIDCSVFYLNNGYHGVISVTPYKKFIWKKDDNNSLIPLNYDFHRRPRRQDFDGNTYLIENGALYASKIEDIWLSKCRISHPIKDLIMPEETILEIDEEEDWTLAEKLFRRQSFE